MASILPGCPTSQLQKLCPYLCFERGGIGDINKSDTYSCLDPYPVGQVAPELEPGARGATYSGLWIHDVVGLFVTPLALAIAYIVIPAVTRRPVYHLNALRPSHRERLPVSSHLVIGLFSTGTADVQAAMKTLAVDSEMQAKQFI